MDVLANPYVVTIAGTLAAAAFYYLFGGGFGRKPRESFCALVGPEPPGASKTIRNYRTGNTSLVADFDGHQTIYAAFQAAVKTHGNNKCLGYRKLIKTHVEKKEVRGEMREWTFPELGPYVWLTYDAVSQRVTNLGAGFVHLGIKPRHNLAVYMETRLEWTLSAHSAFSQNIVVMTVYANLGEEALIHALNQAECTHMVTSGDLLFSLSKQIAQLKKLKVVIYCDEDKIKPGVLESLEKSGVTLYTLETVEALGVKHPVPHNPPQAHDMAVLMYTSGSTGMPKGVMCTHSNCTAAIGGALRTVQLRAGDVHLSYLPLAHILAFVVENGCLALGVSIAYGNPRTLNAAGLKNCKGDLEESRPNFLVGVPTVFDKIKSGILSKITKASPTAQFLFKTAFSSKKTAMKAGKTTPIWNKLVFDKFKSALGGNCRFIVSGGAPLSRECGEFLQVCFGIPVLQGYALTETCAGGTLGELDDLESAFNVGPPITCVELRLVDCEEMGYTHRNDPPTGEVWIRGPNVAKGYYKDEKKTQEEFEDGWFKSGDIGRLNHNGTLSIIDRKKNLIKPPHGEYIAVERLESSYKNCPLVANILVHASPEFNEVLALVFPNKIALEEWAAKQNINLSWPELCNDKRAIKVVLASLQETWKKTNLKSIERISNVALYPDEWTPENGWLTAAMKVQRPFITKGQKVVIDRLYDELQTSG